MTEFKHAKKHRKSSGRASKPPRVVKKGKSSVHSEDKEIAELLPRYESTDTGSLATFRDMPLCRKTLRGLKECGYTVPTAIQKEAIVCALRDKDVLASAVTGSGKTLAFLVPILEKLYINKWSRLDGVGAIVITPTRELAHQIYETLKKLGQFHDFTAGLLIGGKNLKLEKAKLDLWNIIICTPGRLLQHMDENPVFTCDNMKVLVLDEADRCLDMGFEASMNAIIENLPADRRTLLFSATQTKSVRDLARLSLEEPSYVAPHEQQVATSTKAAATTPEQLKHSFVECNLEDKMTMLWSFLKQHRRAKVIVFMSTCKQVKYTYEMFSKLRPGMTLLALYGTLSQKRRGNVYDEFCRKSNVVLFATDIASRGLDFPEVSWVVQLDCPEDAVAYIHRAGRTARYNASGENLLVVLPSEREAMLKELQDKHITIEEIHIDPKFLFSPRLKMESFLAQKKDLKETAQRAFKSYIKSVILMKNKAVFRLDTLNMDAFARSLGLAVTPRVRFLDRVRKQVAASRKNKTSNADSATQASGGDEGAGLIPLEEPAFALTASQSGKEGVAVSESDDDGDDDFMTIKRRDHEIDGQNGNDDDTPLDLPQSRKKLMAKAVSKAAVVKKMLKKKLVVNTKITFNEVGDAVDDPTRQLQSEMGRAYGQSEGNAEGGIDIELTKRLMQEEDKFDKQRFRELVKARRKDKKQKKLRKTQNGGDDDGDDGEQQEQDDFGVDSDSGSEPDLSWLPDPDKIYGKRDEGAASDDDGDEELVHRPPAKLVVDKKWRKNKREMSEERASSSDVDEEERPRKEKKQKKSRLDTNDDADAVNKKRKNSKREGSDVENGVDGEREVEPAKKKKKKQKVVSDDLSLDDAEQLALRLLAG